MVLEGAACGVWVLTELSTRTCQHSHSSLCSAQMLAFQRPGWRRVRLCFPPFAEGKPLLPGNTALPETTGSKQW